MVLRIANSARNAAYNAILGLLDVDAGAAKIELRTGSQPATPATAATGTLLATINLVDPAFGAPTNGVGTITDIGADTGDAAGDAGWFRAYDFSGDVVFDGSITATGGGGQIELNTVTISVGVAIDIGALTFTVPM